MNARSNRRRFLEDSMFATASAAASAVGPPIIAEAALPKRRPRPSERIGVAVVGVRGRGNSHVAAFAARRDTQVLYVCDPDDRVGEKRAREASRRQGGKPVAHVSDFRDALDDPRVDAVSIATPNHWQALAAIWAMQAGKDVYVELPGSHCVSEGRHLLKTARDSKRICQVGLQCRSNNGIAEAMQYLASGALGAVLHAQGLCHKQRNPIGPRVEAEPPLHLNYDLWLGPAPFSRITRQRFHHDWRWLWAYGGGELAGQAIHQLDIARWGLGCAGHPQRVMSFGGRLGPIDSGETANAQTAIFDYGERRMIFEVRSERSRKRREQKIGVIFTCERGYLVVASHSSAVAFNSDGEKLQTFAGRGDHFANFIQAIRTRDAGQLHASAAVGHYSSALCHLSNISYRLGRSGQANEVAEAVDAAGVGEFHELVDATLTDLVDNGFEDDIRLGPTLQFDSAEERFHATDAERANNLLSRAYRAPFILPTGRDAPRGTA